ncbi:SDR family NAD(P)-dependent oxidoreductase [Paraburkholderia sp. J63]|uniref:SDR family NAD(P)-dependent oxidoreductase n=1 Tax=Paraburkholderia sp. J63 TaxID=2805434 RepID=UPI002ABD444C|nr:SDR family NAD(P)-dependent oxidoreductase [Paraburkholderia sp. J63]
MSNPSELKLHGKRIIVTGGASGIGNASAMRLRDMGAAVMVADLPGPALEVVGEEIGADGIVAGDVSKESDCRTIVETAIGYLGGVDALVQAAGISDKVTPALELDIESWQRVTDVNLRGTFLMCQAVGRHLVAQRSGSIVNIASAYGVGGVPRRNAYGPSKAAVAMLTRNLACEWGETGVRVNALVPGYIATPMIERLSAEGKLAIPPLEARTPMRRLGKPEEIANAAAFLISDLASYITGAILAVDGGWTAFGGAGDVATA